MDSKQLYQEVILDHNRKPRNWGKLADASHRAEGLNPLCGDHIWVTLKLADGKVEEAESLMEQRRQELEAQGYRIRKINQAYFAFTNLYAGEGGSPGATNPIGPKLDELRQRSGSLARFVDIAGSLTGVAALDSALAGLAEEPLAALPAQ